MLNTLTFLAIPHSFLNFFSLFRTTTFHSCIVVNASMTRHNHAETKHKPGVIRQQPSVLHISFIIHDEFVFQTKEVQVRRESTAGTYSIMHIFGFSMSCSLEKYSGSCLDMLAAHSLVIRFYQPFRHQFSSLFLQ